MQTQVEQQPSRWLLIGAQGLAYLLTVLVTLVVFFLLSTPLTNMLKGERGHWVSGAILLLLSGMLLAALQRSVLRKWLPPSRRWLLASGAAMPVCLLLEY